METTFENARVWDRVWSVEYGWGTIASIGKGGYPVVVSFACRLDVAYTLSGSDGSVKLQTLFWDEVKIEAPPRPKRKVKKTVETVVVVNRDGELVGYPTFPPHDLEKGFYYVTLKGQLEVEE